MEREYTFFEAMKHDFTNEDSIREFVEAMESAREGFEPVYSLVSGIEGLRMGEALELAELLLSVPPSARFSVQIPDAATARVLIMILSSEARIMQRIDDMERRLLSR